MNFDRQKLESLQSQLMMAQSRYPVNKMQIALLKAQIKFILDGMKPVNPQEVYSPHTLILQDS